jgi:hypothetical protein
MDTTLCIGSVIWIADPNRRSYFGTRKEQYLAGFRQATIYGETSRSWLYGYAWEKRKLPKRASRKELRRMGIYACRQHVEDAAYCRLHHYKLSQLVSVCDDADVLRQVAALVGYTPEKGEE